MRTACSTVTLHDQVFKATSSFSKVSNDRRPVQFGLISSLLYVTLVGSIVVFEEDMTDIILVQ